MCVVSKMCLGFLGVFIPIFNEKHGLEHRIAG